MSCAIQAISLISPLAMSYAAHAAPLAGGPLRPHRAAVRW